MTENQRRKFLKLVGASLAGAVGVSILGCESRYMPGELRNPTRKALAKRLKKLAESEPPTNFASAMCYSVFWLDDEEEPCPECDKIMILGEKDKILRPYNNYLERIQDLDLDATLIIPEHCPACGHGLKEKKFLLEIKYPDDPDFVRVELDEAYDLQLMALFLEGSDRYEEGQRDVPLKNKVDRLRELFGVDP